MIGREGLPLMHVRRRLQEVDGWRAQGRPTGCDNALHLDVHIWGARTERLFADAVTVLAHRAGSYLTSCQQEYDNSDGVA